MTETLKNHYNNIKKLIRDFCETDYAIENDIDVEFDVEISDYTLLNTYLYTLDNDIFIFASNWYKNSTLVLPDDVVFTYPRGFKALLKRMIVGYAEENNLNCKICKAYRNTFGQRANVGAFILTEKK